MELQNRSYDEFDSRLNRTETGQNIGSPTEPRHLTRRLVGTMIVAPAILKCLRESMGVLADLEPSRPST